MNTVIVYATRTGNTRTVAETMGAELRALGAVEIHAVEAAPSLLPHDIDLLLVGGPTEGHGMTEPMKDWLLRIDPASLRERPAAAFDTRLTWPRLLSGSAASGIARRLEEKGARLIADPESFMVTMKPELVAGETERAAAWARQLAEVAGQPSRDPVHA